MRPRHRGTVPTHLVRELADGLNQVLVGGLVARHQPAQARDHGERVGVVQLPQHRVRHLAELEAQEPAGRRQRGRAGSSGAPSEAGAALRWRPRPLRPAPGSQLETGRREGMRAPAAGLEDPAGLPQRGGAVRHVAYPKRHRVGVKAFVGEGSQRLGVALDERKPAARHLPCAARGLTTLCERRSDARQRSCPPAAAAEQCPSWLLRFPGVS